MSGPPVPFASTTLTDSDVHGSVVQARDIHRLTITTATGPVRPVPFQLPRPRRLADRTGDRQLLAGWLGEREPLPVLLTGEGGIGKTALALAALHGAARPPGGVLYADLGAHSLLPPTLDALVGRFLRALGITTVPPDPAEAYALLLSLADDRPVGLLLDNAAGWEQVTPLLALAPAPMVVTARTPPPELLAADVRHHRLGPLPPDAAHHLFTTTCTRPVP
ncbi:hypothetical protein ACWC5I_38740, partial [Kitasatospora sp. NPDC001574]